jgi:hypothetical protein
VRRLDPDDCKLEQGIPTWIPAVGELAQQPPRGRSRRSAAAFARRAGCGGAASRTDTLSSGVVRGQGILRGLMTPTPRQSGGVGVVVRPLRQPSALD